jgi:hypothetical protein
MRLPYNFLLLLLIMIVLMIIVLPPVSPDSLLSANLSP